VNARRVQWNIPEGADFKVYRICKMRFADLLGIGAAKFPGRWNSEGQRATYTSLEIGTAAQEKFSHLPRSVKLDGYALMTIRIDGRDLLLSDHFQVPIITPRPMNPILRYDSIEDAMAPPARQNQAKCAGRIAALIAPSAINPVFNVVLYPDSLFEIARIELIEPYEFHPALDRS
jgi:RES domain-containing protein